MIILMVATSTHQSPSTEYLIIMKTYSGLNDDFDDNDDDDDDYDDMYIMMKCLSVCLKNHYFPSA